MSSTSTNRRSFLARGAVLASVPAIAALAGGVLAEPASADDTLPDYAPVPPSALGPALNAQGYFVGRVEKNLYWVTDGTYQAAFLTTKDGVVLFDAPPTIGDNLQRSIDEIASANGVSNKVTDIIAGVTAALSAVDPTPFFAKYGNNSWAAVKQYQAAQVDYASAPVIKKYTGVLAAADVYTASTAFVILESVRLDLGVGSQVHA
jgi:hypothetical protein